MVIYEKPQGIISGPAVIEIDLIVNKYMAITGPNIIQKFLIQPIYCLTIPHEFLDPSNGHPVITQINMKYQ